MEDNQVEDIGRYARHPLRTAGGAFLIGMGLSMMMSRFRGDKRIEDG